MADAIARPQRRLVEHQVLAVRASAAATSTCDVARADRGHRHRAALRRQGRRRRDASPRQRWARRHAARPRRRARRTSSTGCSAQLGGTAADRRRPPRRARRRSTTPRRCASTPRCSTTLEQLVPLAPLHQPHNLAPIRALLRARAGAAAGRLLRHRVPPHAAAASRRCSRCRSELHDARRAALRLPRPVLRVHRLGAAASSTRARRAGRTVVLHLGNGASMCALAGRPQRRQHDGLHRGRRPADGHALRRARSRASSST